MNGQRVAIVSDPLVQRGGAERVVETIAQTFPDAPVFAILYSSKTGPASLADRIVPSFLQKIPGAARRHRLLVPWYAAAVERFDLSGYDVVISSHHTAAKGVLTSAGQRHICYCHTPMRALWERPHEELQTLPAVLRPLAAAQMQKMRMWDRANAAGVDLFLANSEVTRDRIRRHYGRESQVLYPPIAIDKFFPTYRKPDDYYLVASRNVPYKRIDIAVAAARLAKRRLIIAGCTSPEFDGPGVEQYGHVSDERLRELMCGARALLFPGFEDFGMTPVEVMACGRPVVAYARGGALETVLDGVTGVLVPDQTPEAFAKGMHRLERMEPDSRAIRAHAERFSTQHFTAALQEIVYGKSAAALSSCG